MAACLAVDVILLSLGGLSLATQASLAERISAVANRDIAPMAHLRAAQNLNHSIVISGFAAMTADDPAVIKTITARVPGFQQDLREAFAQLRATTPPEMKAQIDDLVASYDAMAKADETYRANLTSPDVKELNDRVLALYDQTEKKFDEVSASFVKDAEAQRAATAAAYERARAIILTLVVTGAAVGLVMAWMLTRSIRRRTALIVEGLDRLAEGDLTHRVELDGSDEFARMGQALTRSIEAIRTALGEVNGSAGSLADSATGLTGATEKTSDAVHAAGDAVENVSASAETVSRTVDAVATSTVELAASIRDISDNAQQAARMAHNAVGVVESTNATISQLGNSSQEIGNVIQVIQNIASQTSLLALNATIEAARAGDAGRGFAVVAGEVKELARETAEATDSVISRVQAIQADTDGAVEAIAQIGEIIQQINAFQSTIAAAVEEQSVTTDSISASIAEALQVTRRIAEDVNQVATAAQGGSVALGSTRQLAQDVAGMGEQLRRVVATFRL